MHKINPKDLPELKIVDITLPRAVVIFASVTMFFVLPVLGITYLQANPNVLNPQQTTATAVNNEPQVAGVNTEASNVSTSFLGIDTNSTQGLIFMIGVILIGIAFIVVVFLLVDNLKKG